MTFLLEALLKEYEERDKGTREEWSKGQYHGCQATAAAAVPWLSYPHLLHIGCGPLNHKRIRAHAIVQHAA